MFQTVFGTVETQKTSAIVILASADGYFSAKTTRDLGVRRCGALAAYRNHCRKRMMFPGFVFVHTVAASATKHGNPSLEQDVIFACTKWKHSDRDSDTAVKKCIQAISKNLTMREKHSVSCGDMGGTDFQSVLQRHSDSEKDQAWYLVLQAPTLQRKTAEKRY